jgi:pilus assembly protein Flp/PilA
MGATKGHGIISDAARRFAAYTNVAGPSLSHFVRDTRGATAIEYAMIASLISIVIVAAATTIGQTMKTYFLEMLVPFL